jgi:hypothetical protein
MRGLRQWYNYDFSVSLKFGQDHDLRGMWWERYGISGCLRFGRELFHRATRFSEL